MNRILSINYFLQNYLIFSTLLFSQNNIELNSYFSTEDIHFRQRNKILNRSHLSSGLNLSFHANYISNSGHPNIDNNAEIFAPGTNTNLLSARIEYDLPWLSLSLEPYTISYNSNFNNAPAPGTYNAINNHLLNNSSGKIETGFRQ